MKIFHFARGEVLCKQHLIEFNQPAFVTVFADSNAELRKKSNQLLLKKLFHINE